MYIDLINDILSRMHYLKLKYAWETIKENLSKACYLQIDQNPFLHKSTLLPNTNNKGKY